MPTSNVQICNRALNHLGKDSISSLDESNERARRCNMIFESVRDSVLRAHAWNFATLIKPLALLSEEEIPGYDYLYAYPASCLAIRKIYNAITINNAEPGEFKEVQSPDTNVKAIATNIEEAYAEYTTRITDPTLYDANFIEALSYKIAAELAQALTGDMNLGTKMETLYKSSLDGAKYSNASEGQKIPAQISAYIEVR